MDDNELRALLARVQTGDLSPEEAAAALGADEDDRERSSRADDPHRRAEPADAVGGSSGTDFSAVRLVRVRATANRTKVIGDPSVRTLRVDGPHRLRMEGDQAIVENEVGEELFGDGTRHIRINHRGGARGLRIQGLQGLQGLRNHEVLEVRVNPSISVDFDCDAGMIEVIGVEGPLSGRVNAGNAVIEGFAGPIALSVNAGKLRARGRLDGGESSVDVNVGKADVILDPGSSVRIAKSATLGSAEVDDDVVGAGAGTLRISCSLGAIRVHSPEGSLSMEHRV